MSRVKELVKLFERIMKQDHLYSEEQLKEMKSQIRIIKEELKQIDKQTSKGFEILVSDDGKTLTKAHKDVIFEKFYRIPKGNTHDVKGFGIGLYYTKKIIEKHGGKIDLELNDALTTFKIYIPNEQA